MLYKSWAYPLQQRSRDILASIEIKPYLLPQMDLSSVPTKFLHVICRLKGVRIESSGGSYFEKSPSKDLASFELAARMCGSQIRKHICPHRASVEIRLLSVKLRLKRLGRRNRSFFRLNAIDSRSPRDGRVIEQLGWYDPNAKESESQTSLNRERIEYWLSVGAQPSDTVRQLLKRQGIAVAK